MRVGATSLLLVFVVSGPPSAADPCVTNGADETLHFTVESALTGQRRAADLAPGEVLCLQGTGGGTVAAFDDVNSIEGCSRLVPAGLGDRLLEFARFDRCRWRSNDPSSTPDD